MNPQAPAQSLPDIQAAIRSLEDQRSRLHLPPLAQLEAEIVSLGARAAIDQRFKESLRNAIEAKTVAEQQHELAADIDRQLKTLKTQLEIAEIDNRNAQVEQYNARLQQAVDRFKSLGMELCRAYADLKDARSHAERLKASGMPVNTATCPLGFTLDFMTSPRDPWKTSQIIDFGSLVWLNEERGQQREAA